MRFRDRVVVITGAARGIGFEAACRFATEGARVVVNDLDPAAVDRAVQLIATEGGHATALPGDVTDAAAVHAAAAQVMDRFGRIDVLVNNAGTYGLCPAHRVTAADWRRTLAVNLDGMFFWSQAVAVAAMIPARRGAIVNVASGAGMAGIPDAPAYVASKHGAIGLTKALAVDWGQYGIRVNAICPGLTWTELARSGQRQNPEMFAERERRIPLGQAATMDQQAGGILFLASDEAGSMHGTALVMDGGTMAMSSGYSVPRDGE
ncbi:SDR family NAD(P)-dependent oxidoreductase [Ruixingdingia sedimenti]|uniref:SDR family NAD(P)-dependent oxidoreductase n=1 Tax=Ruixingdingia sedimenti TaxID=3073604 RepID=A0ABU1F491_9RHOB|nr:SDR family NAD(P)-dependent oxidoreductase [Xinfangfangia sp. LG-4]MDR5651680.1 SDR family NAD(P)-dependent oxidoreductase [Xinfangfangia sp. LG-4]